MKRISKLTFAATAVLAITGTSALADEPVGGDMGGGGDAGAPADPSAMPPPAGGTPAGATPEAGGKGSKTIGADALVVLPLGDYADGADLGLGAAGRFEFGINEMLTATARVGVLFHIGTPDGISILMIPILAGAKYKIGTSGLFAYGELGLNHVRTSVDLGGMSATASETDFSLGAGAGYTTGKISARGGIWMTPSVGEGDASTTLYGIMGSVGYDFAAL